MTPQEKTRITVTVDTALYNMVLKSAVNKSAVINRLLLNAVKEAKKETILSGVKQDLLSDSDFLFRLSEAVSSLSGAQEGIPPCCLSGNRCSHYRADTANQVWVNKFTGETIEYI